MEFAHNDIDQPVIIDQFYHGNALPPFHEGKHSNANHSGIHTLDGEAGGTWVLDDAPAQLRHSLQHSQSQADLSLHSS